MSMGQLLKITFIFLFSYILSTCNSPGQDKQQGSYEIGKDFNPDIDIELTAVKTQMQLLPGPQTDVFTYRSKLISGDENSLTKLPESYLGPIIRVKQGQKIRVRFKNQLPHESVIHWHGLHISPVMDGHPMYAIKTGEEYIYEFEVTNRPGTYWFHPHPDKITGPQVYHGLAGLFIVEDENEKLPGGEFDMPLVIQDRIFDENNRLVYDDNRMTRMQGFLGNRMMINGSANTRLGVSKATYRFRILNGSNSRIYKLAWDDGSDLIVIGTDGGLLSAPIKKPYVMLAPGERIEVWKDFTGKDPGSMLALNSLAFSGGSVSGMGGMMGGGMHVNTAGIQNGAAFEICSFKVNAKQGADLAMPESFKDIQTIAASEAVNQTEPRVFRFFNEQMQWVINGETFNMTEVADWEKVKLNTTEIWEFVNGDDGRGMGMMQDMMRMPHPVHIHGLSFQLISRDVSDMDAAVWNSVKEGFIDKGWQDTFLLMPGMKVRVIMRFEDFTGLYVYHCHNLEHEDMGMMRNYEVVKD